MSTEDRESLKPATQVNVTTRIPSDINTVGSENLRSKSVPPEIYQTPVDTAGTPRSCSASATSSRDANGTITNNMINNRPGEFGNRDSSNAYRLDENSKSHWMDDVEPDADDQSRTPNMEEPKDSEETKGETVTIETLNKENKSEHYSVQNDPFKVLTTPLHGGDFAESENVSHLSRDSHATGSVFSSDQDSDIPADKSITDEKHDKGDLGEKGAGENKEESGTKTRDSHTETRAIKNYTTITEHTEELSSEEESDTIQPLITTTPRRVSKIAALQFPTSTSLGEPSAPRSRRSSVGGPLSFTPLSPLGKPDTPQRRRVSIEPSINLPAPSSPGNYETTKPKKGSQQRRRSSIAASMHQKLTSSSEKLDAPQSRSSVHRDSKPLAFGTLVSSLVKWKASRLRAANEAQESIAKDAKHQDFMNKAADRRKTELPRPLFVSIQEEAYPILQRTVQAYRSQLGAKHRLTSQAFDRLSDLIRDLESPY